MSFFGKLISEWDKILNSASSPISKAKKRDLKEQKLQWPKMVGVREKVSTFSLDLRQIRSSAVFGVRRRNVLREAGYAWTPDLWSFLKLQEVGFLPTWILFLF